MLCFCCSNGRKLAENVIQTYLSDILAHKVGSVAILSDNGTEFKNKAVEQVTSLELKGYSLIHSTPKVIQE